MCAGDPRGWTKQACSGGGGLPHIYVLWGHDSYLGMRIILFESNRSVETNDTTTKYKKIRFYVRHDEKEGASYDVQNLFTDKLVPQLHTYLPTYNTCLGLKNLIRKKKSRNFNLPLGYISK